MSRTLFSLIIASLLPLAAWVWLGRQVSIAEPAVAGRLECLSYAPFRADQSPFDTGAEKSLDPVRIGEDLHLLANYTSCIRLYSSIGMEPVLSAAQRNSMTVLMGAWVSNDEKATRREIEAVVKLAHAYPQTIRAVLVGNEALLRGEIEPDQLAMLIREVKRRVAQPVSYADVWEFQLQNPQVSEVSDFVTIHVLPYWEDQPVAIEDAIGHVRNIRRQMIERFPGKRVLIGESGWPSVGRMRAGALPSPVNEARFLRGFVAAARAEGWDYNIIEAFDQPWKRRLEGAVGGYWGIFDATRHDKHLFSGSVSDHPHWILLALLSMTLGALIVLPWRIPPVLAPLAAAASIGWTLQAEQLWMIARDGIEWCAALLLLFLLLGAAIAALARLAGRPLAPRHEAIIALLLGGVAAVLSLGLVFDSRFRDFFFAGFLPPALLMLLERGAPVLRRGDEEIAFGGLLFLTAIAGAVNETLVNHQALAWSLASLFLAGALIRRGLRAKNPERLSSGFLRRMLFG